MQPAIGDADNRIRRQDVARQEHALPPRRPPHFRRDGMQAQRLLQARLQVRVPRLRTHSLGVDQRIRGRAGRQAREQSGLDVLVAHDLEEEGRDGSRRRLGAGKEDLGHLVHDVARAHLHARVRLLSLLYEVSEQVGAVGENAAFAARDEMFDFLEGGP